MEKIVMKKLTKKEKLERAWRNKLGEPERVPTILVNSGKTMTYESTFVGTDDEWKKNYLKGIKRRRK
jgi:hypothetical protein